MAKANVTNTQVVPAETQVLPYYDDFNEDKNFHRILFRPGYAVQARELTQVQTIVQNQIERFGRHIFVNGSSVIGGEINFSTATTLNLQPTTANVASFINKTIRYASGNNDVVAKVIQASPSTNTEPAAIHIKYTTGQEFPAGSYIKVDNEELYANLVTTSNVSANASFAYINDSIYFYNGFFVKVPQQTIIISKYGPYSNAKIGLELDDSIITEVNDSSLLDPALEASNYQAPGATRYKMDLVLAKRSLDSTDDAKFIEISRIENGILTKNVNIPVYSEIEEVFARRTYDESGNYTVRPFIVRFQEDTIDSTNNVMAVVSAGKGYVYGYEYETISDSFIQIPKARTKANTLNYNLIANYGNYVIVDGLNGAFDTSGMGVVDIHSVPYSFINRSSTTAYNATKVGTARIKDIEFFSGDTDVTARKFEFYIFNNAFNKITGNASSTANSTVQVVLNSSTFSANTDAYTGATIRITGGPAAGDVRRIIAYDGSTKIANVDLAFSTTTTAASNVSVEFDFAEAESFIQSTVYTSGVTSNANCNITVLNKAGGISNGATFITEPSLSPLVFKYPDNYIAYNSITNQSFLYRRIYSGVQFTNGNSAVLTAGTDEGFQGATATSNIASTVTDNFLVICTNNQGTANRANGEQIKITTSITAGIPEQATLYTGNTSESFLATVYAKMDIAGASAAQRTKTIVLANTQTFATEAAANTFVGSTGSNTSIYLTTGQVVIRNPSRTPGVAESLYISDVVAVKKIYDLNGAALPSAGGSLTSYTDVTSRYDFNSGQRDDFYDHSYIKLKPGFTPCAGPLIVCCRYYSTTTDKGYFSVDSYPSLTSDITEEGVNLGTGYSIIPNYNGTALRDCIDFRPVRTNAANTSPNFALGGIRIPIPATDFTSDYQYYLSRRDLVVLTATGNQRNITRVPGRPAKYPQLPIIPSRAMVLSSIYIPPYTDYASNVSVKYANTRRYTMRDISLLDQRITNLEYYVSLTQLEKNALDLKITDVDGLDRAKYGVFVDSFKGHSLGDYANPDYKIATDINGRFTNDGMAMPQSIIGSVKLVPDMINSSTVTETADRIVLNYTEEPFITQNIATKFTAVADYLYASFEGNIMTTPEADTWKDVYTYDVVQQTNVTNERTVNINVFVPWGSSFGISDAIAAAQRQLPAGYKVTGAREINGQYDFDIVRV